MTAKNLDLKKLKKIVRDEKVFNSVVEYFNSELTPNDSHPYLSSDSFNIKNCFWMIKKISPSPVVFYSDSIRNTTGFSCAELNEKPGGILSIIYEEDLDEIKRRLTNFESSLEAGASLDLRYRLVTKDEKIKWMQHNFVVTSEPDGSLRIESIALDVDNFVKNGEDLEARNLALTELNAAKDKFISIISHDLRAPFTSLLGFSEILLSEPDLPQEEREEYLKYIYDASSNQLNLINYLLDWSRLKSGRIHVEKHRLSVKNTASNCKSNLTGAAMRKSIEMIMDVPEDLFIEADERLISQAILNLLSNAVKFTPENGKIFISAGYFKEGIIEIVIKDEGIGIPEKDQEKIFKIDEKFSTAGTKGEKGTGFGLTLVSEIIEKHDGDIWFYSKPNEGTEFHFTVKEAKNIILLVEDDVTLRSLYTRMIKNELKNFDVFEANNGYEAISMLLDQTPSLLIVDHAMPLMNGTQLIQAMREKELSKAIPVIVVSAQLNDEIKDLYSSLGVNTLIEKPFDYSELLKLIKNILQ